MATKDDTPRSSKRAKHADDRRPPYKEDWHPWHADEPWNPIPPHLRQCRYPFNHGQEFNWEIPNGSWTPEDMQSALAGHLRDLQEKKHSIMKQIQERDPGSDFDLIEEEPHHCPNEMHHWALWNADEEWNPIPPSWREWPLGHYKKEEVARILHVVHDEIRVWKQRLQEMD